VSSIAFANIESLVTNDESLGVVKSESTKLGERAKAGLVVEHGRVVWVGDSADLPDADSRIDVGGQAVIPGFVDSHAHLMFAGRLNFRHGWKASPIRPAASRPRLLPPALRATKS
jgi:imidazolonepropionase